MIPGELPLVQELTATLREWAVIWRKLYVVSVPLGLGAGGIVPSQPVSSAAEPSSAGGQPRVSLWGVGASDLDRAMDDNQQVPIPQSRVMGDTGGGGGGYTVIMSSVVSQLTPGRL